MMKNSRIRTKERTIIVNRTAITFNDTQCQMLSFADITPFKDLLKEKETSKLLKTLNESVHHEMMGPLSANVNLSQRLLKLVTDEYQKMIVKNIFIASQLVLLHASDLLDQRIIEQGGFTPSYSLGNLQESIFDIVELIRTTTENKNLTICYDKHESNIP